MTSLAQKDIQQDSFDLQSYSGSDYVSDFGITQVRIKRFPGFKTRSGYDLPDYDLAYLTLGELSKQKDNAILICHSLSGNAHVAGLDTETNKPGWWDFHVGPGKTIDTNVFFVISINVLGGCNGSSGPSSLNPETGKVYAMSFPPITIQDMVWAQSALIDALEIDRLFAVIGGSLGGMQAIVWATDFPERVRHCIPIASCMAHSAMQIAFNETGRQAIITDPNWQGGNYYGKERPEHGLAVARMVGHITYLSEYSMRQKFGRRTQRPYTPEDHFPVFFSVESYLQHQGASFVRRFDPNSYLYITKALDMFDLLDSRPAHEVFDRLIALRVQFLVISFESDWLYPPTQSRELVRTLKRCNGVVSYVSLDTPYGHDSFLIRNDKLTHIVRNYLRKNHQKLK